MDGRRRPAAWLVVIVVIATVLTAVVSGVGPRGARTPAATAATFNPNLLISNAVFDATGTMDTAAIQRFLDRYPKSCLRSHRAPLPLSYSSVGSKVSAAKVISASAAMWKVNPQVLLVTLEKEQSLVSGAAGCASWRYSSAMGYNCPDGGARYDYPDLGIFGTCVQNKRHAGFTSQVNHGAWQLQFNRQRASGNLYWNNSSSIPNYGFYTRGTHRKYAGAPAIYYDGNYTISQQRVYMSNGPTASLYTYTPHVSANRVFVTLFTSWFGSPITPPSSTIPPTTVSPPDPLAQAAYIDNVYRIFLGRPANTIERDWWSAYLGVGRRESSFVRNVTASSEYRTRQVAIDYVVMLHRAGDRGGMKSWSRYLDTTGRNDTVLAALAGSNEYFRSRAHNDVATFVGDLYLDFLGRNVDRGGLQTWSGHLRSGSMSRTQVAFAILQSHEYATRLVGQTYPQVLGRKADKGGLAHWAAQYMHSRRIAQLQVALAASGEGVTYLSTLR